MLVTQIIHKIDLGWILFLSQAFAFFPEIKLANHETLQRTNFDMVFFISAIMAIGSVTNININYENLNFHFIISSKRNYNNLWEQI